MIGKWQNVPGGTPIFTKRATSPSEVDHEDADVHIKCLDSLHGLPFMYTVCTQVSKNKPRGTGISLRSSPVRVTKNHEHLKVLW
jgi:hypothetical protein